MFCYHCKNYWHANQTCDQARQNILNNIITTSEPSIISKVKPQEERKGLFLIYKIFL